MKMIEKTDGQCNIILVEDPDQYVDGLFHKIRHKATNLQPKKKKRK
jgi:hypothetical protein